MTTDAKPVNWAELEEYANELRAWLQSEIGMETPPRTVGHLPVLARTGSVDGATQVVAPSVVDLDGKQKFDAARAALLRLTDFEGRRVRANIHDIESFRDWQQTQGIPVRDEDAALLPLYSTSDIEMLLGELREGQHWAARLGRAIQAYAIKEHARAELVPWRGVREAKEAAIGLLEEFRAALESDLEQLAGAVSQDNNAVLYPLTVRGQEALLRDLRRRLKGAGFKPAELPKLLKQRRY